MTPNRKRWSLAGAAVIASWLSSLFVCVWTISAHDASTIAKVEETRRLAEDHEARVRALEQRVGDVAGDVRWIRTALERIETKLDKQAMSNPAIDLADAIVTELNGATLSMPVAAERAYLPIIDLEEMATNLIVRIAPGGDAATNISRAQDQIDLVTEIGVMKRFQKLPANADIRSNRVRAGLGVIPRIVADGEDIYDRKLKYFEARRRLAACYDPYHQALSQLIDTACMRFGCAVVIDCHSMPSAGGAPFRDGDRPIDMVLGDRFGTACFGGLTSLVEQTLTAAGFHVSRNAPYAGGYVASAYGRPSAGVHVLQIEINRALYLDEKRFQRSAGFESLRAAMTTLIAELSRIAPASLRPAQAAE